MQKTTFLGGRVVKQSLPTVPGPAGPNAPARKRLLLPQGELAQLYDGDPGLRYLAALELRAGEVRGNHYHEVKEEYLYVIQGEVLLLLQDVDSQLGESVLLRPGDLAFIPTRIAHALKPAGAGLALEFSAARFDPADIYRFVLA